MGSVAEQEHQQQRQQQEQQHQQRQRQEQEEYLRQQAQLHNAQAEQYASALHEQSTMDAAALARVARAKAQADRHAVWRSSAPDIVVAALRLRAAPAEQTCTLCHSSGATVR